MRDSHRNTLAKCELRRFRKCRSKQRCTGYVDCQALGNSRENEVIVKKDTPGKRHARHAASLHFFVRPKNSMPVAA
jgi:hypothetical protein